jgi:hypothetical protein
MSGAKDDPRDASLETKVTLPKTWSTDGDNLSSGASSMFFAGLIMMTRNRFLAWPAIIFAINGFVNQHPLRSQDGNIAGGWNNILLSLTAFFAVYFPLFMVPRIA